MSQFNNPLSSEKADRLIALLDVPENGRVLDVGCGHGEFLIRVIEACDSYGLGFDTDSASIAAARDSAGRRIDESLYEFRECNAQHEPLDAASFDLAICVGSTHAFGDGDAACPNTLRSMLKAIRPGGQLLVGKATGSSHQTPSICG